MQRGAEEFKQIIKELLPLTISEIENKLIIKLEKYNFPKSWEVENGFIENIFKNLSKKRIEGETSIYDEYSYEILIKYETTHRLPLQYMLGNVPLIKEDSDNGLVYEISKCSDEYFLFILKNLKRTDMLSLVFPSPIILRNRIERAARGDEVPSNFLDFMKDLMPRLLTVKIRSQKSLDINHLTKLVNAFTFHIGYNLNISIIEVRFLDDFVRSERISRLRRTRIEDLEPPRRIYTSDLVYYYKMAISTDSPISQYISFYHVAEHFFEAVYNEELLNLVKDKITSPDFSYKRKKDLKDLVSLIEKKLKFKEDNITYNEQEALYLTLKKYVDLESIKIELSKFDATLLEYYQSNQVSFSEGDQINFEEQNVDNIYKELSRRIYKTRNSVVHGKETVKPRYIPFVHDKELLKEIPLMRFIAEQIIIKNSDLIQ
nr:hypothetical protein [Candidatus Freyarchaeota archaeon]